MSSFMRFLVFPERRMGHALLVSLAEIETPIVYAIEDEDR